MEFVSLTKGLTVIEIVELGLIDIDDSTEVDEFEDAEIVSIALTEIEDVAEGEELVLGDCMLDVDMDGETLGEIDELADGDGVFADTNLANLQVQEESKECNRIRSRMFIVWNNKPPPTIIK